MKIILTSLCVFLAVVINAQGIKLNSNITDFSTSQLVIIKMDSLITQTDSLKIAKRFNEIGIQFEDDLTDLEITDQMKVVITSVSLDSETQCFVIFKLSEKTKAFTRDANLSLEFIHANALQYMLIDKQFCNRGLEPTIVLALCDLLKLGPKLRSIDQVIARLQHNEWLKNEDKVFVDTEDISKVYRYQSELKKLDVDNVQFIQEDTDFTAWSRSELKNSTFIDRRKVTIKGQTYIITLFLDIGKGLKFVASEKEAKRSTPLIGKPYLEFLYQDGPIKMNTPLDQQNLEFKVPKRQ